MNDGYISTKVTGSLHVHIPLENVQKPTFLLCFRFHLFLSTVDLSFFPLGDFLRTQEMRKCAHARSKDFLHKNLFFNT